MEKEYTIEVEIKELKQVRILADHCNLPLKEIKKNIDRRIKIFEDIIESRKTEPMRKDKAIRIGNGKQLTKYSKTADKRAERETEKRESEQAKKKTYQRRRKHRIT